MNLEKNKKDIFILILFTVSLIFSFIYLKELFAIFKFIITLLMPFLIGCGIAFVLNVLLKLVEEKLFYRLNKKNSKLWRKFKRTISLTTTFIIIIAVISFILILVIPQLQNTFSIFIDNIDTYKVESIKFLDHLGIKSEQLQSFSNSIVTIKDDIITYIAENKEIVMQQTLGIASTLIGTITTLTIGIVFAAYILAKKEVLGNQLKQIMKAYLPEKKQQKILNIAALSSSTFGNFISGQCLEAVIIGTLCFLGMIILNIPYAPTIAVLVGFTALIPVFGAFIGTIVGAFLIFMINPAKAILFVIFILILQQIEGNFIYPKVVGKSIGLPSIWVMVAVTVGASISGIMGMLFSVPLCSVIYSIFKTNVKEKLEKK